MFRPHEREANEERPHRYRQRPSYLQDYEVGYPGRSRFPEDEHTRHISSPEIIRSFKSMREENDRLRRDVQRLADMIHSAPTVSSRPASLPKRQEETSATPAPTNQQTPIRGFQGPRQPVSAPPVIRDVSPAPVGRHAIVESLRQRLQETGLSDQAEAPDTAGTSDRLPKGEYGREDIPESPSLSEQSRHQDDRGSPPRGKAHHQPEWPDSKPCFKSEEQYDRYSGHPHRRDDRYHPRYDSSPPRQSHPRSSNEYSRPAPSYRHSSLRAHPDSRYYGYERGYSSSYRDHPDDSGPAYYESRQREGRHSPDPSYSSSRSHSPYRRAPAREMYRGPKPTIPDFKSEDPREFARLKLALDNLLPYDASEHFKFQILTDHLKCEEALLIADSYSNSHYPFTDTMMALTEMYGQPQQLALKRISNVMDGPNIRTGDIKAFKSFALQIRALVGMLHQLGNQGWTELQCGSHVSRLLAKLPHDLRANFHRFVNPISTPIPTLLDLADWLEYEVRVQVSGDQHVSNPSRERSAPSKSQRPAFRSQRSTTILLGSESDTIKKAAISPTPAQREGTQDKPKKYCPFCDTGQHYFNQCSNFKLLSVEQKTQWIKTNNRCWRCGREHLAAKCNLKAKCKQCERKHLDILHEVNTSQNATATGKPPAPEASTCLVSSASETLYIDRPASSHQVLLKLSRVILQSGDQLLETYAILDDGSERTILLNDAAIQLGLQGQAEELTLRTVRQEICSIQGATVSFTVASASEPEKCYKINKAFTARELSLAHQTYPVQALQDKYRHLRDIPLPAIKDAQPLLLIGSDYPHLITPVEPVRLGPLGGPAAVRTRLGWTLQGPTSLLCHQLSPQQCLFTICNPPESELLKHVEKLWQLDILPYRSERLITRSRQDAEAVRILEKKTTRVMVDGVNRYATPLLWKQNLSPLHASKRGSAGSVTRNRKTPCERPREGSYLLQRDPQAH
ncbi:uncharacterized protein LOC129410260 [Boleophthalmus pectinirostris]|uniref:uncharacterized protein LOC129410260 n=1 Tax=Boleophthalmus pectinirostris TaxID=150288 RepID=UPI00242DA326|nr:uncharacterized protein LOC129410260 [Boleophthalmus pectinirostris]